ncbi:MAG TPA: hypothetical protein VI935_05075 [Thermodesulfobacteriota bacterium]|nr:hypothetical protein [Thermodesulfobacteriota bacterium]
MKTIAISGLILFTLFNLAGLSEETETPNTITMAQHPEWYIKITDWSFYATRGVGIIHHVTIENTSDIAYKNVEVRVHYYSTSTSNYGTEIGNETGVLNVVLAPHSKKTYLEGGAVFGAGSSLFNADNIEVLGALPATGAYDKGIYPKLTL